MFLTFLINKTLYIQLEKFFSDIIENDDDNENDNEQKQSLLVVTSIHTKH